MRVMIADAHPASRTQLASAVGRMRAISLAACVTNLTETYHAAESRPPQAVMVAENLARLPEFEVMQTLFQALNIRCIVVADSAANVERLAGRLNRAGTRVTHMGASEEELRQCLLGVLLDRPAEPETTRRGPERLTFQPGRLILIGASTGGVDALIKVLGAFPSNCPPTLIVQHTSGTFSAGLARLLDRRTEAKVAEAEDGQPLEPGTVLLAPGKDHHLELGRGGSTTCRLRDGPPQSGHRPSVDALFQSAVPVASRVTAAILTGMGRDGAEGMLALHRAGAHTIGQNRETSLVYGMPRAAFDMGGVRDQRPLDDIGAAILQSCIRRGAA